MKDFTLKITIGVLFGLGALASSEDVISISYLFIGLAWIIFAYNYELMK